MKNLISTQPELDALCQQLAQHDHLAVDTEFIREKTYWPQLCLIQAAWDGGAAAIDPLADLDLSPFLALMADTRITKIFHAARQDLEIFYKLMGKLPAPIVDTQIMALALGYAEQMAYDRLMAAVLKVKLTKGSRFTDWSRRPLTDAQMEYALADVIHLLDAYHKMEAELQKRGRGDWLTAEYEAMLHDDNYDLNADNLWQRVKIRSDDPKVLGRLRALAGWRESEAQRKDLPRSWMMKDEVLVELALSAPKDIATITNIRGLNKLSDEKAQTLIDLMKSAEPLKLPPRPEGQNAPDAVIELLRVLLRHVSESEEINPRLIASPSDLNDFAIGADSPIAHGWRYDVFGKNADALMNGEIALQIDAKRLKLVQLPAAA